MHMPIPEVNKFLEDVCCEIKYKSARSEVRNELMNHIDDHAEHLIDMGYDSDEAYRRAAIAMGDSKSIGKALNKEHRPYLGFLITVTNLFIAVTSVLIGFYAVMFILMSIVNIVTYDNSLEDKVIVHEWKINESQRIDYRNVKIQKAVLTEDDTYHIFYMVIYLNPFVGGWGLHDFAISDDLGNTYYGGGGSSSGLGFSLREIHLDDVDPNAKELNLKYDYFNRFIEFNINIGLEENKES